MTEPCIECVCQWIERLESELSSIECRADYGGKQRLADEFRQEIVTAEAFTACAELTSCQGALA